MKANGVAPGGPVGNIQLTPKQAVVLAAQERLLSALGVEVQQLDGLFGMREEAARLAEVGIALRQLRDAFLASCSPIIVAKEVPKIIPGA